MADLDHLAARMLCVGLEGPTISSQLRDLLHRGVSSVILFTRNYESPAQLADLCCQIKSAANRPIMICVDQEGGRVQRFREPFTIIPSQRELGSRRDPQHVQRIGRVMARELRAVNIDMNLAPVLDVDSNPANPVIGERSFGRDPQLVATLGCALIEGMQSSGLAACAKHFPGHGDTSIDSHFDLPRVSHSIDRLEHLELVPFRAAINAGVAAVMTSHILFDAIDPARPATMSAAVLDAILRNRMGFNGVVLSDDLEMKAIIDHYGIEQAVVQGAAAGVDLLCVCKVHELQHQAIDALIRATEAGAVPRSRIDQANARLDALMHRFVRPASKWNDRSAALLSGSSTAHHHSPA